MNNTDLAAVLSSFSPFQVLDQGQLDLLADKMQVVDLAEDALLFAEGDVGDSWYLILSGEVLIVRDGEEGAPSHTLAHLGAGEGFGEMALLEGAPRMASASAFGAARLARLPRETFEKLLADNHPCATSLLRHMSQALCQRLREVTVILQDIVDNPAPIRADPAALKRLIHAVMAHN